MKKILVIAVTYHSNKELQAFLESVRRAAEKVKNLIQVDVEVVDNGQDNKGYLGGALPIYNEKAKAYYYTIISNVDIILAEDFFGELNALPTTGIGWIVPRIYSACRNTEENPQAIYRYSKAKIQLLHFLYAHPNLYRLYRHSAHKLTQLQRNKKNHITQNMDIYAGNGSFFLFTQAFVQQNIPLQYPCFLYGEEIYFAELVQKCGLRTVFVPNLYIENKTPNVSTSRLGIEGRCAYSKQAMDYLLKTFY